LRVMPSKFALTSRDAIAVTPRCKIIIVRTFFKVLIKTSLSSALNA
jgi:hypothetical protein